jgi:hypothetical protein
MPESVVKQIKIMISSTRADLSQYREEASKVIAKVKAEKEKRVQLVELSMEKETQSGNREFAVAVSKRWVEESDWVVVIVGWNYGTISQEPGADGLSVTEWEYKYASQLRKKLFVFIAGDPDTPDQYRVSKEEKQDLKDWIIKQTVQQAEKLKNFKHELRACHVEMFADLQRFLERLEKTLKDAIDDRPPEIQPGTPLADLIVAVTPNIRDCMRKVTLIANCKRIHNYAHELRQNVIRPLREEVLSVWKQEGTLSLSRERVIWHCMAKRSEAVGGIRAVRPSIGPDHQGLRCSVDAVLHRAALWNIESDPPEARPEIEDFAEVMDEFAVEVQEAFSEADRSMAREESELRERYHALREELKRARRQTKLGPADQQRLDAELEQVDGNRQRVKNCLISHHSWQEAHDKLEELDSFREQGKFEYKLNHYRGTPLAKLLLLVDQELEQTEPQYAPSQAEALLYTFDAFVNNLRHLKTSLEALREVVNVENFDKMRKPFDDAFYYVDKRTLGEVERAHERVVKLEGWLDDLIAAQK